MEYRLFLFFILFFFSEHPLVAQLTVSNTSYIFVDGSYIYAEVPVDLKHTTSHIYLRNEGQLLQGDFAGYNEGVGSLSVYQTGNVHEYAYNYWCSPIGSTSVDNALNTDFVATLLGDPDSSSTIVEYVPASFTSNYEGSSQPLIISKRWLYTYNSIGGANPTWNYVQDTGDIAPGLGFTMKGTSGSGNSQIYEFRGKPNTGTLSATVIAGESTLIGNPYPSGLDALAFIHDVDNVNAIDGTLYFWEQDLSVTSHYTEDYVGGYATYTISSDGSLETFVPAPFSTYHVDGSINTTGNGTGSKVAGRYIPIGQGFMVEGKVGTTGVVTAKNSHRVYTNTLETPDNFFRVENNQATIPSQYKRLILNIDFDDIYTRQLVHNFNENASSGFDYGLESLRQSEVSNDAYWIHENETYVAQASVFDVGLAIPIVIELALNSNLGFRLIDTQNFDIEQHVYLYDNLSAMHYELTNQNVYLNLDAGYYDNRFEIRFQNETLGVDENTISTNLSAYYDNNSGEIVILNRDSMELKDIFLYDLNGRLILNTNLNTYSNNVKVPIRHYLATGIYFLKCSVDGSMASFKLLVK